MASRSYTKPNTRPLSPLKILTLIGLLPSLKRSTAACKAVKPFLDSGLRKVITTGASTSLWYDNYISNGPLRAQLIGPLNVGEETQLIAYNVAKGGLICDLNGNWVQGFLKPISTTSILMAELWALREGICMGHSPSFPSGPAQPLLRGSQPSS
nr:hypothetical protein CFP56_23253 [Quercus suber]